MKRLTTLSLAMVILAVFAVAAVPALAQEAQGRVMAVSMDNHQITVQDNMSKMKTFQIAKDCTVLINNQPSHLTDIKSGDDVTVIYERQEDILMAREVRCNRPDRR